MFQFDAGTFTDTLNLYGNDVLTVAGNTSHALDYVTNMVKISAYTTNAETDAKALQWIVDFDVNNGTLRDQWIKTVTHYYNGCKPGWSCWNQRYAHYDDSLQTVIDETGLDFWVVSTCQPETEICNGKDDDCDEAIDEDEVWRARGSAAWSSWCCTGGHHGCGWRRAGGCLWARYVGRVVPPIVGHFVGRDGAGAIAGRFAGMG